MSTSLVTLAVVVVALICVLATALREPDQTATTASASRREAAARLPEPIVETPPLRPSVTDHPLPAESELATLDGWREPPVSYRPAVVRIRSGVVLVVLLTVVGALLAVVIGTAAVLAGLALKQAVS